MNKDLFDHHDTPTMNQSKQSKYSHLSVNTMNQNEQQKTENSVAKLPQTPKDSAEKPIMLALPKSTFYKDNEIMVTSIKTPSVKSPVAAQT